MNTSQFASAVGKGLVAGLVGTAVMTVASTIEQKLRHREASDAPAEAATKITGIQPHSEKEKKRISNITHWTYGTLWGGVRGLIGAAGLHGVAATAVHFAAVWGAALIMLPALRLAPPATKWGAKEVAIDGMHHAVYASAAGTAYELIDRS